MTFVICTYILDIHILAIRKKSALRSKEKRVILNIYRDKNTHKK